MTLAIADRGASSSCCNGLLFIDLETCCRGPVEFDIAHATYSHAIDRIVFGEVGKHYPGTDLQLVRECQLLLLAMVAVWRWHRDDQLPNGRRAARSAPGSDPSSIGAIYRPRVMTHNRPIPSADRGAVPSCSA
jgi:hypothetical protein